MFSIIKTMNAADLTHAWQPSLFGMGTPSVDPAFQTLQRHWLDDRSWVDHAPGWLGGHVELFEQLRDHVWWRQERRWMYDRQVAVPRLMGKLPQGEPGETAVTAMAQQLGARYGVDFDRVSFALYRDGQDSVAPHGDQILRDRRGDSHVVTVSLGERRSVLVAPRAGGRSRAFTLGWGDLMVMGGQTQQRWLHGVPKVAHAGPRLAVMFRSSRELSVRRSR